MSTLLDLLIYVGIGVVFFFAGYKVADKTNNRK